MEAKSKYEFKKQLGNFMEEKPIKLIYSTCYLIEWPETAGSGEGDWGVPVP